MDNVFIILIVLLMSTLFAIYKMYQTKVTGDSFIKCIYLYILLSILFISILTKYTASLSITEAENMGKMIILYFIIGFSGLSLIYGNNPYANHLGLALLCISLSLTMGVIYKKSTNFTDALMMTSVLIFAFTMIVFYSNEKQLISFVSMLTSLTNILCVIIIIMFAYIYFGNKNETFRKILSGATILLFLGYILADTSKILLDSKILNCDVHSCINYPKKTVSLLLDFVNIFVNMNK